MTVAVFVRLLSAPLSIINAFTPITVRFTAALHRISVLIAMCYYKMDFYDVSLEILLPYLQQVTVEPLALTISLCCG